MPLYRNSRMYTAYGPAYGEGRPCEVRIGDGSIVVSYPDEEGRAGFVVYEGNEVASGHYALMAQAVNGTATAVDLCLRLQGNRQHPFVADRGYGRREYKSRVPKDKPARTESV